MMGAHRRESAVQSALTNHLRSWTGDADVSAEMAAQQPQAQEQEERALPSFVYMVPGCSDHACYSGACCVPLQKSDMNASFESLTQATPRELNDSIHSFASMHSVSLWKVVDSFNALMACAADVPEKIGSACSACSSMCGRGGPVDPPGAGSRFDEDTFSMKSWFHEEDTCSMRSCWTGDKYVDP